MPTELKKGKHDKETIKTFRKGTITDRKVLQKKTRVWKFQAGPKYFQYSKKKSLYAVGTILTAEFNFSYSPVGISVKPRGSIKTFFSTEVVLV